jgi:phosphomevalonate kinase
VYRKLHTHLIHHEVNELRLLGSRHAVPLLNTLLDEASSAYEESSSISDYKEILDYINAHISVRNVESILVLEKSSQMKNTRIATTAILAIGNFYHESSVATLVKLFCTRKNDEIAKVVAKAIENVYKKCPEADRVIIDSLDTECRNHGKLKKLYRRLSKEKPLYYQ